MIPIWNGKLECMQALIPGLGRLHDRRVVFRRQWRIHRSRPPQPSSHQCQIGLLNPPGLELGLNSCRGFRVECPKHESGSGLIQSMNRIAPHSQLCSKNPDEIHPRLPLSGALRRMNGNTRRLFNDHQGGVPPNDPHLLHEALNDSGVHFCAHPTVYCTTLRSASVKKPTPNTTQATERNGVFKCVDAMRMARVLL